MTIPTTSRQWSDAVEAASNERQLLNLVIDRPIVAWFLKGKGGRAIQLLTKVSARLGDDCWIIQGIGFDETKKLEQGHMTMAPRPLKVCLHWPTYARGSVLF